ncbi:type IV secretory system conjugative DNA transfer family protein [Vibrio sp. D431a]|uniref:type IV secretory system conjugative DNA transfer family protein n=1 Tax=Vibrio sp. D431a TaxID=2837388 RepID=UPI0025539BA7|nr:type IV secretory system conjugative DNA transfer family protein [Vibrio sp. D431a]MDK9793842.1 type IV secretory system conjugative DNA transfer family protein [Vibrio sp. D431a]
MSAIDLKDVDTISTDAAREVSDNFYYESGTFVFDDSETSSYFDENIGFNKVSNFTMPDLLELKNKALTSEKVAERRDERIERGLRAGLVFNEGVRYGAQYGYAHTLNRFKNFTQRADAELRSIYNFNALMLADGKVLPPVISMTEDYVKVTDDTYEHIDERYVPYAQAKFIRRAPIYLDYLSLPEAKVDQPNIYMIPLTPNELTHWKNGVYQGWIRGRKMADQEVSSKVNQLHRDFFGMVRFHIMLKYGAAFNPVTTTISEGVTADEKGMDVGVTKIQLKKLSTFNPQSKLWKALPKIDKLETKHLVDGLQ